MIALEPGSLREAQEALAGLHKSKLRVRFEGAATKVFPAGPVDAVLRTGKLARVVEYAAADQVITAEAGLPLAALQEVLRVERQRLSLDPPFAGRATLGGLVAANAFGPRRARFGAIRDLILGVSLVRMDGVLARGGGKVVKNVAGFDLPKLLCGSLGTLGLIAQVSFRVHPLPEAQLSLLVPGLTAAGVPALAFAMRGAQLEPSALVARRSAPGRWDVAVLFEGDERSIARQGERLRAIAPAEPAPWGPLLEEEELAGSGLLRLKICALPTALPAVEAALASLPDARLSWYPTLGLGAVLAQAEGADLAAVRRLLPGTLTVEAAPAGLTIDRFGAPPPAIALHRALKQRFDPDGLLAPGSFIGGI